MPTEEIRTDESYQSDSPLSQAVRHGDTVYVSGTVGFDPETGELVDGGVAAQTAQVLENVRAVLEAAGTSMENVVRAGVFLADVADIGELNDVYREYLSEPYPARTAVEAEMADPDILVEIDVVAAVDP